MEKIKRFDESNDFRLIDGSGLFFWNSSLDYETKLKIVNWYNNLSEEDKRYVDILRAEASDEAEFYANEDESI